MSPQPDASHPALKAQSIVWAQAMRQTLLKKYAKIRSAVERLHNSRMSPYETMECHEAIRSEIAACWRTDEIRRTKPTPQVCRKLQVLRAREI